MSINLGPAGPTPSSGEKAQMRTAIGAMGRVANTAAGFTSANTVLLADQMGVETDTLKFKIGNGATAWNSLAYAGGNVSDTAYNEATWNGVTDVAPSKNAVRDKFESLPAAVDPTALTFAGADPNGGSGVIVSGAGEPTYNGYYEVTGTFNGRPYYGFGDVDITWGGTFWVINDPAIPISTYLGIVNVATPDLVGNWSPIVGAPTPAPTVSLILPATHLGQFCRASTAWWQWNGTVWLPRFLLNGKQITRDDADSAYFSLGVDAIGLPTTTPFP